MHDSSIFYVITSYNKCWVILTQMPLMFVMFSRTFMVMNECPHTFATFPPLPKCPCLGGTHSSIKVWPKILFPASRAAVLFGRYLTLSPWFISVLNSSFLSSSPLRLAFGSALLRSVAGYLRLGLRFVWGSALR